MITMKRIEFYTKSGKFVSYERSPEGEANRVAALRLLLKGKPVADTPEKEARRIAAVRRALTGKPSNAPNWRDIQRQGWEATRKTWSELGYNAKHKWVRDNWGRSDSCDLCGRVGLDGHRVAWANKDHLYSQDRNDWMRVCRSCHAKYDREHNHVDFRPMRYRHLVLIG